MNVLVLESSTSSAKAMVYDTKKGPLRHLSRPYSPCFSDGITQDAEGVFAETVKAGREAAAGYKIDAVALVSTWHGLLALYPDREPAGRVRLWSDTSPEETCRRFKKDAAAAARLYAQTGCPVNAMYPLFKLMDMGKKENLLFTDQGGYHFLRLTGRLCSSRSMASGSALLNLKTKAYDPASLSLAGIEESQLPELTDISDSAPLLSGAARALGLSPGTPVFPALPDGAMNQVGADALEEGVMTFSVGTSAALRLSMKSLPALPEKPAVWCYLTPFSYLLGAATSGAGNCVNWARRALFDDADYEQIEGNLSARREPPLFLPFLFGERSPGWDGSRRGGFLYLEPEHTSHDLYRAVLEGVLFHAYQCANALTALAGEPKSIRLSGGILNSPLWTAMCADIFGRPMEIMAYADASLLGGAKLAAEYLGEPPLKEKPLKTVFPSSDRFSYQKRYERYLDAYEC